MDAQLPRKIELTGLPAAAQAFLHNPLYWCLEEFCARLGLPDSEAACEIHTDLMAAAESLHNLTPEQLAVLFTPDHSEPVTGMGTLQQGFARLLREHPAYRGERPDITTYDHRISREEALAEVARWEGIYRA